MVVTGKCIIMFKIPVKSFAPLIPYGAIFVGLYVMRNAWAAVLFYHLPVLLLMISSPRPALGRAIRTGWHTRRAIVLSILCAASGAVLFYLWPIVRLEDQHLGRVFAGLGLKGVWWWLFAVYFVTWHPLSEEIFWRFYLGDGNGRFHWHDAAFAGFHALVLYLFVKPIWVLVSVVVLFFAAWMWRRTGSRFGGLGVALVTHAVADASIIVAAALVLHGESAAFAF